MPTATKTFATSSRRLRVLRSVLFAAFGIIVFLLQGTLRAESGRTLSSIAECLTEVRSRTNNSIAGINLTATVTLVDETRGLVILQDDVAAMAVQTPLTGLNLRPGQRVRVEGNAITPYVRAFPAYPDQPNTREFLRSFEAPSGRGSYYLTRIRGYLHPPVSGKYTFWIAADDTGELWISADASPERMQKIASNQIGNAAGWRDWDRYTSQRSQPVTLKAGEAYYVEALHVQAITRDGLSVAWAGPGIERAVIEGRYLTPWIETDTGGKLPQEARPPTNGLLRECWTNFFVRDYETLRLPGRAESIVPIRSLKLTVTGEGGLPSPQRIDAGVSLHTVPNLHWVELEGDVNFVAGNEGKLQLELKREDSVLGVRVLDRKGLATERLMGSSVRVQGILEHAYGPNGELTSSVMWVPNGQHIGLLEIVSREQQDLNRVSICEITPSDPQMSWGRRISVRGQIINRTTNGLVVVEGNPNYEGFCSANGTNWISLGGPVEIDMRDPILAGLAVVSGHDTEQITASFAHLEGWGTNWRSAEVGGPKQAGSFSVRDGILDLKGSGRKMGERGDQLYYLNQPLPGEAELSVQLKTLTSLNLRPQAGLMARATLDSSSPFAAVLFTPAGGPVFQYRRNQADSISGFETKQAYRPYRWLKLIQRKSLLLVQGEPGPDLDTNQEVRITGMITWQNNVPILTDAVFESPQRDNRLRQPIKSEPPQSIANFVARALNPPEPNLIGRMGSPTLRGIVTFCGDILGQTRMFVQSGDEEGIQLAWSDARTRPKFEAGQLVEMRGNATIRKFPVVLEPFDLKAVGWGTLPKPVQYSPALVKGGGGQARWMEATGIGRSVRTNSFFNLMTKDGVLAVWVGQGKAVQEYVDAWVRVRGVLSMDSNRVAQLLVPSAAFVEVQEKAPEDPFAIPRFSIAQLAALDVKPERLRKMKLAGVVTCCLPTGFYVQDETGGAFVRPSEETAVRPGDQIEAVGFPERDSVALVMAETLVRKTSTGPLPEPKRILPAQDFNEKDFTSTLITLEGTLLEQRRSREGQLLSLQLGTKIIEAAHINSKRESLSVIPVGSRIAVSGVCQVDRNAARFGMSESERISPSALFRIWLRTPVDVVVLERPPWWTVKRVAWAGGLFAGALLGALIWVRILRRRVAQRTLELQATMGKLEKETRTSAVLAERDRLAGEIHDSLEQGLTAIMLQLDAAARRADDPEEARRCLKLARNMATFSRAEVEHAVWDLQSPLLANAGLNEALAHIASEISAGNSTQVDVQIIGPARQFPSAVEHHLLRIGQEAITNALKHAQARTVHITLDYSGPEFKLAAQDDGVGFVPDAVLKGNGTGHFGLHGIRSRARKIDAKLAITSQPGKGTNILVTMPLPAENGVTQTGHNDAQ